MTDYITVANLRSYMGDPSGTADAGSMQSAVTAASRRVETLCGRTFFVPTGQTVKYFDPTNWYECDFIDRDGQRWDLANTTGLVVQVDIGYNQSYATTYVVGTDFDLSPTNGTKAGQPWPYQSMMSLSNSGSTFPIQTPGFKETIKITGSWGWPTATPDDVIQACYVLAEGIYKRKDAPFGVAGNGAFGDIRVRTDPLVMEMLEPYVLMSRFVA